MDINYLKTIHNLGISPMEEGSMGLKAVYILTDMALGSDKTSEAQRDWAISYVTKYNLLVEK